MNPNLRTLAQAIINDTSDQPILLSDKLKFEWFTDITVPYFCSLFDFEHWPYVQAIPTVRSFCNGKPVQSVQLRKYTAFKQRPDDCERI